MTCEICRKFWSKRRREPPCDNYCDYPGLWEENLPAWNVYQVGGATFFDGWGGINLSNMRITAENLGYSWDLEMQQKCTAIAAKLREGN